MGRKIDRHMAALLIKTSAMLKGRSQYGLALKCGISKKHLNEYLNRHIDLLPDQIDRLTDELDLQEMIEKLSAQVKLNERDNTISNGPN